MALAFPPIYLLDTHLADTPEKHHEIQARIPSLTKHITEAKLVLGLLTAKKRAQFELRCRGIYTKDVDELVGEDALPASTPPRKRRKVEDTHSSNESDYDSRGSELSFSNMRTADSNSPPPKSSPMGPASQSSCSTSIASQPAIREHDDTIKVVKLAWFEDSLKAGVLLPIDKKYLVYEGFTITEADHTKSISIKRPRPEDILSRAYAEASPTSQSSHTKHERNKSHRARTRPVHLLRETTSEHDNPSRYPPVPSYFESRYSCCWPTPLITQNDEFISLLKKIQHIRELLGDEVGVKAYGKAAAAVAAYPYALTSAREISRLPGCKDKMAMLFQEFLNTGRVREAERLETEEKLIAMNKFFDMWYCGDSTALNFWNLGYREIEDVVNYHWSSLNRLQSIGLKHYDDFLLRIPRVEVESIANIVLETANEMKDGRFQMVIAGSYRRGKKDSGDVDVILSHPDEKVTLDFIRPLADKLMEQGYIKHANIVETNSKRGQQTAPMSSDHSSDNTRKKKGFCTLDKANVAWQDPDWPTQESDIASAEKLGTSVKNPNPHRRVDIIISPWATVGCAVAGWTNGTTFNRDLRTYCEKKKGLKFDSSGVRRWSDGKWVDLEGPVVVGEDGSRRERGKKRDMLEAEKRVFEALGLMWLEPELRCTG